MARRPTMTLEEASEKMLAKFPDKGFELLEFTGSTKPCKIACPDHGLQTVSSYLNMMSSKHGCPKCGRSSQIKSVRKREPMDTIPARLAYAITKAGHTAETLAKKCYVKLVDIEHYLAGNQKLTFDHGEMLAEALGVPHEWIRYGAKIHVAPASAEVKMEEMQDNVQHLPIPLYDLHFSAGEGNAVWYEQDSADDHVLVRCAWLKSQGLRQGSLKAIYVRGDSMQPYLMNHDTVILDTEDTEVQHNSIYALVFKGNIYIKQVLIHEKGLTLHSYNADYPDILVTEHDRKELQILGRQVWRAG